MRRCEMCGAFPPNMNDEAFMDSTAYVCRATGLVVRGGSHACSMFYADDVQVKRKKEVS